MMRLISEYDLKMSKELDKWEEYPDGECHLREDAPEEVKKYYEKLQKEFRMLDLSKIFKRECLLLQQRGIDNG